MVERPHLSSMLRRTSPCMIRPARSATRAAERAAATASIQEIRDTVSDLPDAVWRMCGLDSLDAVERIMLGGNSRSLWMRSRISALREGAEAAHDRRRMASGPGRPRCGNL